MIDDVCGKMKYSLLSSKPIDFIELDRSIAGSTDTLTITVNATHENVKAGEYEISIHAGLIDYPLVEQGEANFKLEVKTAPNEFRLAPIMTIESID